jgi:hypothetical protein
MLPLTGNDNINVFGELLEASLFSVNPNYYGQPGLHNDGHWIIANLLGNFPPVNRLHQFLQSLKSTGVIILKFLSRVL